MGTGDPLSAKQARAPAHCSCTTGQRTLGPLVAARAHCLDTGSPTPPETSWVMHKYGITAKHKQLYRFITFPLHTVNVTRVWQWWREDFSFVRRNLPQESRGNYVQKENPGHYTKATFLFPGIPLCSPASTYFSSMWGRVAVNVIEANQRSWIRARRFWPGGPSRLSGLTICSPDRSLYRSRLACRR